MSPANKHLFVFDWNGTLFDDAVISAYAINKVLKLFGVPSRSLDEIRDHFNVPIIPFYAKMGVPEDVYGRGEKEAQDVFVEAYESVAHTVRLRKGAYRLLKHNLDEGHKQIILSNHITSYIEKQLARLNVKDAFSHILAYDNHHVQFKSISKGEKLAAYLETLAISSKNVFIVGDTREEVKIAQHLDLKSIAILGGLSSEKRLQSAQPSFLIKELTAVPKILKGGDLLL